jgi:hypothetical protein
MKGFRAFGAGFALVLLGFFAAQANVSPFWGGGTVAPGTPGPWLGDSTFNINNLFRAIARGDGRAYAPSLSVSQTSGQANCTQLNADNLQQITTSASTGYVCLPSGGAGKEIVIYNGTTQSISIYANATNAVSGTTDTINGTVGSTAYTGLTTLKTTTCYTVNNGVWSCGTTS